MDDFKYDDDVEDIATLAIGEYYDRIEDSGFLPECNVDELAELRLAGISIN